MAATAWKLTGLPFFRLIIAPHGLQSGLVQLLSPPAATIEKHPCNTNNYSLQAQVKILYNKHRV